MALCFSMNIVQSSSVSIILAQHCEHRVNISLWNLLPLQYKHQPRLLPIIRRAEEKKEKRAKVIDRVSLLAVSWKESLISINTFSLSLRYIVNWLMRRTEQGLYLAISNWWRVLLLSLLCYCWRVHPCAFKKSNAQKTQSTKRAIKQSVK